MQRGLDTRRVHPTPHEIGNTVGTINADDVAFTRTRVSVFSWLELKSITRLRAQVRRRVKAVRANGVLSVSKKTTLERVKRVKPREVVNY